MGRDEPGRLARRKLLYGSAAVIAAGAAATGLTIGGEKEVEAARPRQDFYRRLGRTNLRVSSVGIGGGGITSVGPLIRTIARGINFIDTSVCYGDSEIIISKALRRRPDLRNKVIIATKWDASHTDPKDAILASLDRSLRRLGVERVDIMQIHNLGAKHVRGDDGFNRLDNDELYRAMDDAKASGKVRFFGATSHNAKRSAILQHAIDKGHFDMILVKMNVLDYESASIPALLAKAAKKDVGVVVMKSQPGGGRIPSGFEKSQLSIFQANLRWVLQHSVACIVHSKIGSDDATTAEAIHASQQPLSQQDEELLRRYGSALSSEYCRGCDELCGAACPDDIAIADVLQFDMYREQYGWRERAEQHYRALPRAKRWSDQCASCNECSNACPYGVDAAARVRHAKLTLDGARSNEPHYFA